MVGTLKLNHRLKEELNGGNESVNFKPTPSNKLLCIFVMPSVDPLKHGAKKWPPRLFLVIFELFKTFFKSENCHQYKF